MDKEEKIIRSFFEPIEDINQSESIQVLPLSLVDMLLEYEESIKTKTLFEFKYTYCIHESAMATMSLHRTKKGAYKAMRKFIVDGYNEWRELGIMFGKQHFKFGTHEAWGVEETEVLD